MSGTPIEMSKVKQVIRMHESGVSIKGISRKLSISKNTVKEYLRKVESHNLSPPELLEKELDKQPWEDPPHQKLPLHDNIRGADYYQ